MSETRDGDQSYHVALSTVSDSRSGRSFTNARTLNRNEDRTDVSKGRQPYLRDISDGQRIETRWIPGGVARNDEFEKGT
jgi:hypothetical protein